MTLLEQLRVHVGGLIRLKSELYWHSGPAQGWDGALGRVCLLLDAVDCTHSSAISARASSSSALGVGGVDTLLLIDGQPRWVWIAVADVELL